MVHYRKRLYKHSNSAVSKPVNSNRRGFQCSFPWGGRRVSTIGIEMLTQPVFVFYQKILKH